MARWGALLVAVAALGVVTGVQGATEGMADNIAFLMTCTACERVVEYLNQHFIAGVRRSHHASAITGCAATPSATMHTVESQGHQVVQKDEGQVQASGG